MFKKVLYPLSVCLNIAVFLAIPYWGTQLRDWSSHTYQNSWPYIFLLLFVLGLFLGLDPVLSRLSGWPGKGVVLIKLCGAALAVVLMLLSWFTSALRPLQDTQVMFLLIWAGYQVTSGFQLKSKSYNIRGPQTRLRLGASLYLFESGVRAISLRKQPRGRKPSSPRGRPR